MRNPLALLCVLLGTPAGIVLAAEDYRIEEILVMAQRIEENSQKVPMAVSAFTDSMIEDRQIIGIVDLQLNVPNFSYIPNNFGSGRVTIRGIGELLSGGSDREAAGPSVPIHINGISALVDSSVLEFYDLERIEVLRGPQGTLYGRTATAGAMNLVTQRPTFDGIGGYVDLEYGDYNHVRAKGAFNWPVTDQLAFRVAGMSLDRDGYIDNKAAGQIPGIDDDIDGRDLYAYRITGEWRPSDALSIWLMYSRYDEDDSKVRISNQVCKQHELPNLGCEPDEFGLDPILPGAQVGGLSAAAVGAIPVGAKDAATGLIYEFPRPELDLREQHTDFNPVFEFEEDAWLLGVDWALDAVTLSLAGSYFDTSWLSQQDFNADVGYLLNPTAENPSGLWPTSAPSGGPGALRGGGPCDLESGRAGVFGPCTINPDLNRAFQFDQSAADKEFWSAELRARSDLDGRFNFLLGANYIEADSEGDYYVLSNTLDVFGVVGAPGFGQLYPSFFNAANEETTESYSIFGEIYVDLSERLKITVGLRYNYDELEADLALAFLGGINLSAPGMEPTLIRVDMLGFVPGVPFPPNVELADYYGATASIQAATSVGELVSALQIVPVAPRLGESQDLQGLPRSDDWDEVTGRLGLDWSISEDALIYAFFSQGYRPGGLNVNLGVDPSFDSEKVHAYEIGAKTSWADGSLTLNGAAFFNDHEDLQIVQTTGVGAVTTNVDAETMGFELEAVWRPVAMPRLALDFSYAWLNTEITDGDVLDVLDRTQGDPSLVNLRDSDPGLGDGYVAPIDQVLPLVDPATAAGFAVPEWGVYDNGIPVYFSRGLLSAFDIATSQGRTADLDGNELPNSPPHSVRLGSAYTWPLAIGALTLRYDYYWQDSSYGRGFNTRGDEIDSWDQQNASATFESADGRWVARAWVRNITDEEIVTAHFLQGDSSGNFRNYFMAEPRIYGASLRYNFGDIH